ncbi:MAG: transposase [Cytophagales bacterium]|nr:transposase [Cytophagales bacterium]
MSRKYKFHNKQGLYFVSIAAVYWIDVFIRDQYFHTVVESLGLCRKNKELELYAWCIMPSHIHMVFKSKNEDPGGLFRDFKTFTSKEMQRAI